MLAVQRRNVQSKYTEAECRRLFLKDMFGVSELLFLLRLPRSCRSSSKWILTGVWPTSGTRWSPGRIWPSAVRRAPSSTSNWSVTRTRRPGVCWVRGWWGYGGVCTRIRSNLTEPPNDDGHQSILTLSGTWMKVLIRLVWYLPGTVSDVWRSDKIN